MEAHGIEDELGHLIGLDGREAGGMTAHIPETVNPRENAHTTAETAKLASEMKPVRDMNIRTVDTATNTAIKVAGGVTIAGGTLAVGAMEANNLMGRVDNDLSTVGKKLLELPGDAIKGVEDLLDMAPHPTMPSLPGLPGFTGGTSGVVTILVVGIGAFVMYEIVSRSF